MKLPYIIFMLVISNLSYAAEPSYTKQYSACMESDKAVDPIGRIACMTAETKRQGAKLEAVFKTILKETPKEGQPKVREAQREWLKYLSVNCDAFYDAGEQMGGMLAREESRASCVLRMTRERTTDLDDLLEVRTM